MPDFPKISVIAPCRNEIEHIAGFIDSILAQKVPAGDLEILIVDGMSSDGTRGFLNTLASKYPNIRIIDNPERITSYALNRGVCVARGEIIIRMDVHAKYASDFIAQCVKVLHETQADNVGGPTQAVGKSYFQKAIALAFHSPFSSGGAGWHTLAKEGEVDTIFPGCWRKSVFDRIGLFDEELVRNQDDEFNLRLILSGGKIWQSPAIKCWYYPRSSLKELFTQYVQYGYWKVRVIQKHKLPASFRHLVPGMFVGSLIVLAFMSFVNQVALWLLLCLIGLYGVANIGASFMTCIKPSQFKYFPVMPFVFAAYHFGYGYGFLRGMIDFLLLKKSSHKFSKMTRGRG